MKTDHINPPHDPDEQALLDFGDRVASGTAHQPANDLEATVARVHNALRASITDTTAMPADLKTQIWENIMTTIPMPEPAPSANPWPQPDTPANRNKHRRSTRPAPLQRMAWSGAANIALALVLILAAFGAFRAFEGELPLGGGGSDTPGGGQYAQAPMTPEVVATPEDSEAISACDFSRSVPIYSGVDAPSVEGTVLYITSSGDLTLACTEEPQPIVLSHNVVMASATNVPGVVQIQIPNGNTTVVVMMNVITGEWIQLNPSTFSSYLGDANMGGLLQISTVVDSATEWSLLNLQTMRSVTLSGLTGAKFPASHSITVATAANGKGVAVAFSEYKTEGSATLGSTYGAEGDVAVIADDLETVHWVSVPSYFPEVTNISLSPDASRLALISNLTSHSDPTALTSISVIDVATGEEIVRSEQFIAPTSAFFLWVENGDAIVYTTDSAVYRLETAPDAVESALYSSDGTMMLMPATTQPNLVHLKEQIDDDESNLVILTTDTGDAVTVEGTPWFAGTTPAMHWTEQLHPIVTLTGDDGFGSWNIVDPRTGESLMTAEGAADASPVTEDGNGQMRVRQLDVVAEEAPVSAVLLEDGSIATFDLSGIEPAIDTRPGPPEEASGNLRFSPDGTTLIAGQGTWEGEQGPWWVLDLNDPESEWVQGPEGSIVTWLVPTTEP